MASMETTNAPAPTYARLSLLTGFTSPQRLDLTEIVRRGRFPTSAVAYWPLHPRPGKNAHSPAARSSRRTMTKEIRNAKSVALASSAIPNPERNEEEPTPLGGCSQ